MPRRFFLPLSLGLVAAAASLAFGFGLGEPERGSVARERARRAVPEVPPPRIGSGPRFKPAPAGDLASAGRIVGGLRCTTEERDWFGAHLEVFVDRIDMVIPAGIGIAPPRVQDGAYVRGGRCEYPIRTTEPTGVIEIERGRRLTLDQLFEVWGQPLSRRSLAGFRARAGGEVLAFVNGRRWRGDPRRIPLERHAAIVLELGKRFPPIRRYLFPPGL